MRTRLGGIEGNEILTSATAVVLTLLLLGEGITIVDMGGLRSAHMFIGLVLIPPLLLKLGSTGYRFARYYAGARTYREKGPPALPLRLMAPVLVATTIGVFVTGVLLLLAGHKSNQLVFIHKVFFFVWAAVFAVHFLAYLPRVVRSLRDDWTASRREQTPGSGLRGTLLAATAGGGAALAIALLPTVNAWHGG
ncbi:MAG: hypothetical protein QOD60_1921 [Solirubrobacterales bacterium]|jgi:hypothetical protein|nr:hypothetical protein [Solirubrobacterales bacterium]